MMAYSEINYPDDKAEFYALLQEQVLLYTSGAPDNISALANAAAVIGTAMANINWAGFYLVKDEQLVLGPFQGRPAIMAIEYGQGICGTAWMKKEIQIVNDVHCFPGHIACDCSSVSELVVPVIGIDGRVIAVIDIDSPLSARFDRTDADGMQAIAGMLASFFD